MSDEIVTLVGNGVQIFPFSDFCGVLASGTRLYYCTLLPGADVLTPSKTTSSIG